MSYSRRDAQDKEITFEIAADATAEHPYASTGHGRGAYVSALPSTKARTAFPVGPLARKVIDVWKLMAQP